MPRLIWVFVGCTGHFVGFVMFLLKLTVIFAHIFLLALFCCVRLQMIWWFSFLFRLYFSYIRTNESHDKTNKMSVCPAKAQISLGICPVWSESSLCAQWVAKDPRFLHAESEDSNQTGRIWVFAGHTFTLLALSCRGSNDDCGATVCNVWDWNLASSGFKPGQQGSNLWSSDPKSGVLTTQQLSTFLPCPYDSKINTLLVEF